MSKFQNYKNFFIKTRYPDFLNTCPKTNKFKIVNIEPQHAALYISLNNFLNFKKSFIYYFIEKVNSYISFQLSIGGSYYIKCKLYHDTMKFYNGMRRLIRIAKIKYQHIYNDRNLYLDEFEKDKTIILNENNTNYVFEYLELYKICKDSLTYLDDFNKLSIIKIKNPYTNIPFSNSNIYNIYFILEQKNLVPYVLTVYFKHNFNIRDIYIDYNFIFLKEAVKSKFNNLSTSQKCNIIREMVDNYDFKSYMNLPNNLLIYLFNGAGRNYYCMNVLETHNYIDLYSFDRKISKCLYDTNVKYPRLGRKIYYKLNNLSYSYVYINPILLAHFCE